MTVLRLRIEAIQAVRLNYTRRGVWTWLKGRERQSGARGWQRVLREPERVRDQYRALAGGGFS